MKTKPHRQHITQPHLKIIKTLWHNRLLKTSFVVVDLNGEQYPQNFVCMFPKNWHKRNQKSNLTRSRFFAMFGEKTYEVAETLLEDALKTETDPRVKIEIEARLSEVRESDR